MLSTRFGIEIEMTGITRETAAKVASDVLDGVHQHIGTSYDTYEVIDSQGRTWNFMRDGSIYTQKKTSGRTIGANSNYSVELVSPILTYQGDIEILQNLVRALRKAGAFTNSTCGIHIHLDGANHNVRSIRNFVNIAKPKQSEPA